MMQTQKTTYGANNKITQVKVIRITAGFLLSIGLMQSPANAELDDILDRAHCAGYADAMSNTYKNRNFAMMAEYFGIQFEQDGGTVSDPSELQSEYDKAYNKVDTKERMKVNYDDMCEADFAEFIKKLNAQK